MRAGSAVENDRHLPHVHPVPTSGPADDLRIRRDVVAIETTCRVEFLDITGRIEQFVHQCAIGEGLVVISSLHFTCSVLINEFQHALTTDMATFLERLAPDIGWSHNDPECSDCDRMNADADLRALLLGPAVTVQVAGGELVLGQWQRIILAELDGARVRHVSLQAWDLQPIA